MNGPFALTRGQGVDSTRADDKLRPSARRIDAPRSVKDLIVHKSYMSAEMHLKVTYNRQNYATRLYRCQIKSAGNLTVTAGVTTRDLFA